MFKHPQRWIVMAIAAASATALTRAHERQAVPKAPAQTKAATPASSAAEKPDDYGRKLFTKVWVAHDPQCPNGDGLGPMYNDNSCVACHSQAGPGGGGPRDKNVRTANIVSQSPNGPPIGVGSVVLHRASTLPGYEDWLKKHVVMLDPLNQTGAVFIGQGFSGTMTLTGASGVFVGSHMQMPQAPVQVSGGTLQLNGFGPNLIEERSTPALFGAGLIDRIAEADLAVAEAESSELLPGRLPRDADGNAGRFGWKGQTSRLDQFVVAACTVELGLQVSGKNQPVPPHATEYESLEPDLSEQDCLAMVSYIRGLPAPQERSPRSSEERACVKAGSARFLALGCAGCHRPELGQVAGIYSDLLLHDLGPELSSQSSGYGVSHSAQPREIRAAASEWRTPPLWGVSDSAPYLHDGRAGSLESAILLHGGQAKLSRDQFAALSKSEQQQLVAFLESLHAPPQ